MIPALFAITLACVIWSLYTRRITWRCFGETGITLSLALQGTGLFLMTPVAAGVRAPPRRPQCDATSPTPPR